MMQSPYTITMTFDMTTEDGRMAHEYARLGPWSHLAIWKMWDEMCKTAGEEDEGLCTCKFTRHWISCLLNIMDDLDVPLEIG